MYLFPLSTSNSIVLFNLALIAEVIRRHHYCESVSVVGGEFKPIDFREECVKSDDRNGNIDVPVGIKVDNGSVGELGVHRSASNFVSPGLEAGLTDPSNRPIERIRKGYRLSSKCWD